WGSNNGEQLVTAEDAVSTQKEFLEGFTSPRTRKMRLGGRKMVAHGVLRKETGQKQGLHGGSPKDISGANCDVKCDDFEVKGEFNMDMKNLGRETKPASLGTPRSEPLVHPSNAKPKLTQDSKTTLPETASLEHPSKPDEKPNQQNPKDTPAQHEDMQRLLEATKEIVNLMHKDYSGKAKPRRKPPINNRVPIH
ncbi:hypothetical protein Tsubulata_001061, partial [Turnera subulata]